MILLLESAGIVFGGGFPRGETLLARRASQRVIFHVQDALQRLVLEERAAAIALCDRGTVDGLVYWPDGPNTFWTDVHPDLAGELARYTASDANFLQGEHIAPSHPRRTSVMLPESWNRARRQSRLARLAGILVSVRKALGQRS